MPYGRELESGNLSNPSSYEVGLVNRLYDEAKEAYETYETKCPLCGNTILKNNEDSDVICSRCKIKYEKKLAYAEKYSGFVKIRNGIRMMLEGLSDTYGLDPDDENFRETPERITRFMMDMNYGGVNTDAARDIIDKYFPSDYDGLISSNNNIVYSLCPHHGVLVKYVVHLAYVPAGRCVGLSKLSRYLDVLAKSMILQEDYTKYAAEILQDVIHPAGVGVMVYGQHGCVASRGVEKPDVENVTCHLTGVFSKNPSLKDEWMRLIQIGQMNKMP